MDIRLDFGLILAVYLALVIFGIGYNSLVSWMEGEGYAEGYMALIVGAGVGVSLAAVALFDWRGALLALGAFLASGTPMLIGSIARHARKRRHAMQNIRRETLDE